MTTRSGIVEQARKALGVRFRHQGRVPERGFDCIGLVVWTLTLQGVLSYDRTDYSRRPDPALMSAELNKHLQSIALNEVLPGDVLRFKSWEDAAVHVGIATDKGVIHATAASRQVIEHRLDPHWLDLLVEAYRIPGIEP